MGKLKAKNIKVGDMISDPNYHYETGCVIHKTDYGIVVLFKLPEVLSYKEFNKRGFVPASVETLLMSESRENVH